MKDVEADLDADALIRRAEAAVEGLKDEYPKSVEKHLVALDQAYDRARANPDQRDVEFEAIAGIAHDVKGEGGSYGYPLMTALGGSLYTFAKGRGECGEVHLDIINKHIEAMRAVIRERLEGDGGEVGKALLDALEGAVVKFAG